MRTINNVGKYEVNDSVSYITPNDCNEAGIVFKLIVQNEHGLLYTDQKTLTRVNIKIDFYSWEDNTTKSEVTNKYIVVGQNIRYKVLVSADREPSSVKIDGVAATREGSVNGSGVSNTVWYIDYSNDTKGVYNMNVEVKVDNTTASVLTQPVTVYGLKVGSAATTLDANKMYLIRNTNSNYQSTYCTSSGTSLAANTSQNYYNLFVVEDGNKIKSVARNQYFNGTTATVNFNGTATTYTISGNNANKTITTSVRSNGNRYTTYYLRQSNNTQVSMSTTNNNCDWNFLVVEYDIP